jgi:hypothetical protein
MQLMRQIFNFHAAVKPLHIDLPFNRPRRKKGSRKPLHSFT